ncbi:Asp-tRNA(Asn)/Glu-tRNA(Gln) amidotransferase subunit GatA [SAR86 cluster bacterium]|nr:Asp-tRNA(Asn)/Glu-tRNA(Gln) amidotransferase subunit GatA [SAR86 cluster bacterium]
MTDLTSLTLLEQRDGLKNKKFSSEELTSEYLKRIDKKNKDINCFISIDDSAIEKAKKCDEKISNNSGSVLEGIPIAHKDIFCIKDQRTTCGSKMLDKFISPYSSTVYEKLSNAGVITLGKTNMDEFAMGSSNETSFYGSVKNPIDLERVPGGSSGGSAAAVSANLCSFSTGTDTGGSIRQPAAFCGVTGIKPTYGRVSRWGMIAFASSLDQGGVFAKTALDASLALENISGFDPKDSTSINKKVPSLLSEASSNDMDHIVGIPKSIINNIKDVKVKNNFEESIKILKKLGIKTKEIELPNLEYALPVYYVIAPAECSANLSRYDGVRFGYRCEEPKNLDDLYSRSRAEGFGDEVKKRILIGTFCLSAGYYDAYYIKAQKIRNLIKESFLNAFKEVSSIAMPTCANVSFKLNSIQSPVEMYEQDIYTIPANLAGLPAMSVPSGKINNLPLGIQFIGNYLKEGVILNLANKFQEQTDFHKQV